MSAWLWQNKTSYSLFSCITILLLIVSAQAWVRKMGKKGVPRAHAPGVRPTDTFFAIHFNLGLITKMEVWNGTNEIVHDCSQS
jgi:hypothetical protein